MLPALLGTVSAAQRALVPVWLCLTFTLLVQCPLLPNLTSAILRFTSGLDGIKNDHSWTTSLLKCGTRTGLPLQHDSGRSVHACSGYYLIKSNTFFWVKTYLILICSRVYACIRQENWKGGAERVK